MAPLPPLVLLPGMDCTGTLFAPLITALGPAVDTHPMAYPRDQVLDYDALEGIVRRDLPVIRPFLVVAESFSGPLAIRLAASPPPGLAGVVLVATFASSPVPIPGWLARTLRPALAAAHPPRGLVVRRQLGPDAPEALADALMAAIHSVELPVMAGRQIAVLEVDERAQLERAAVPVAYLQAAQDSTVPARSGRAIQALCPELHFERVPGPHLLLQSEPQACVEALERIWERWSA